MAIWMLHQAGVELEDLSRYANLDYHDLVVEKVLRGDFDAGMVKAVMEETFQAAGLRVLMRSPAIPSVPLVAGAHVDSLKLQNVRKALLDLKAYIDAGTISTEGWDRELAYGFRPGYDSLFNFPRKILAELDSLQ